MAHGSSLSDSQVLRSRLREHLGLPMGPRLELGPKPLRLTPALAALLGIAGAIALADRTIQLLVAAGLLSAVALGSIAYLLLRRRQRFFLTPFERGVAIETRHRKLTFLLENLQTLELRERETRGGLVRRISLDDGDSRVRFEHVVRKGEEDRLGVVFVPLLARLVEVTEQKVQEGGMVAGWNWVLSREGLSAPAEDAPIPLDEIGAVTVRKRKVAIWRPHDRYPFFVLPDDSPNALVLMALLSRRLEERE